MKMNSFNDYLISFGAPYADATALKGADVQPYKYNGKELDLMHGLNTYDYGARQHDPILARWDRIDPLCEKYYSTSPYAYCLNNPINAIDPNGMEVYVSKLEDQEKVLGFISQMGLKGEYSFDDDGFLCRTDVNLNDENASIDYNGDENGQLLDGAIKDKNMLQIAFRSTVPNGRGGFDDVAEYCGGAVSPAIPLKDKNGNITREKYVMAVDDKYTPRKKTIGVDDNELEYGLFDRFIHELYGHGIPALKHQMGDAIELENNSRERLGKTGRKLELNDDQSTAHPTIKVWH